MKLHNETVSPQLTRCLKKIMQSDIFKDFNLVGGTCLSLQLGHRRSIDIDLFTAIDYGSMNTTAMKVFLQENFPYSENLDSLDQSALGYSVRIGESPADCIKADFLQDEKFGDFIAYLYRTFRKKEGSITLAAQNILFLKNMPASIKDSIIINCATKIILDHSEHRQNLPEVKAVLSITDEEIYMIESLQRTERWREFFIKMSNDAFIFRNEVSDFAAVAFDSRQATVVRLKQLFNESGSTYTAINRYLEERRKKYG